MRDLSQSSHSAGKLKNTHIGPMRQFFGGVTRQRLAYDQLSFRVQGFVIGPSVNAGIDKTSYLGSVFFLFVLLMILLGNSKA